MSDSLERRKLARAAARMALERGSLLPPLALMTDDERLPDPLGAARALPRGSLVVVRARDPAKREILTRAMLDLARARGLLLVVSDDPVLAAATDGLHLPETRIGDVAHWRTRRFALITTSAHSLAALRRAQAADAVFLSPVFPTQSHPGRAALTAVRANAMARATAVPVYALGGIDARNTGLLRGFCGIAAIGALAVD